MSEALARRAEESLRAWEREHPRLALVSTAIDRLLSATPAAQPTAEPTWLRRTIHNDHAEPYLTRTYVLHVVRRLLPGAFLHMFHRSDSDRELHNHPWDGAYAFVLSGGYLEQRIPRVGAPLEHRFVRPFSLNRLDGECFHRVTLASNHCWTIFIAGKKKRRAPREAGWGFIDLESGQYEDAAERERRMRQARRDVETGLLELYQAMKVWLRLWAAEGEEGRRDDMTQEAEWPEVEERVVNAMENIWEAEKRLK